MWVKDSVNYVDVIHAYFLQSPDIELIYDNYGTPNHKNTFHHKWIRLCQSEPNWLFVQSPGYKSIRKDSQEITIVHTIIESCITCILFLKVFRCQMIIEQINQVGKCYSSCTRSVDIRLIFLYQLLSRKGTDGKFSWWQLRFKLFQKQGIEVLVLVKQVEDFLDICLGHWERRDQRKVEKGIYRWWNWELRLLADRLQVFYSIVVKWRELRLVRLWKVTVTLLSWLRSWPWLLKTHSYRFYFWREIYNLSP